MTRWLPIGLLMFALTLLGCKGGDTPNGDGGKKENKVAHDGAKADKDAKDVNAPKADGSKDQKAPLAKADFVLTSEQLAKEYFADGDAAKAKYSDKLVEVTGAVWMVRPNGEVYLSGLKNEEGEDHFKGAVVGIMSAQDQYVSGHLSIGQKIKITGKYGVPLLGATLQECALEQLEPSKLLKVSAENLAKEFEADYLGAFGKYQKAGELLISGPFDEVAKYVAKLKGTAITKISFIVVSEDKADIERLKKGTAVEVRTGGGPYLKDGDVVLLSGFLLKKK